MKDLSDMKISEFIDAILAHPNEYSQLEVYDYLDDKTKGFSLARVDAILELLISKYPTNNLTPEERDWRFKLLTLEEWHNLSLRPDPSKYQIKVNEIENWVTIRLEKPRDFDPRGQATMTPAGKNTLPPYGKIKMTPENDCFSGAFL